MKKYLLLLIFLFPFISQATTVISIDGGLQSCYQYGVDHITGTITFTGTSNQWQFGLSSLDLTGYSNAPDVRYVTNGTFNTSISFDIDFTGAYDGSIESYLPIETYRYYGYAQSDGFDYNDGVFTLQADPCITPEPEATTTDIIFNSDLGTLLGQMNLLVWFGVIPFFLIFLLIRRYIF